MLTIIIRSIIIYIVVLFLFRIMGKRQLGQMQPFELVLTLIIADLATIPMAEVSVPVLHGIIPLFTLVLLHFILTVFSKISPSFSYLISGKPVIVINSNGVDYRAMKKLNLSIDDLLEAIRGQGYFNIDEIQYAIMETNGKISVMPKASNRPVTTSDLDLRVSEGVLPVSLVCFGKILPNNLELVKLSKNNIENFLYKKVNKGKIKDVLFMTIDKNNKVVLQMINGNCISFEHVRMK